MRTITVFLLCLVPLWAVAQDESSAFKLPDTYAPEPDLALSEAITGPVIDGYGPVYRTGEDALNLRQGKRYKVLMDVSDIGDFAMAVNPELVTAARFLNMQVQHGIQADDLSLTLVVHGAATKDLLNNDAYRARFGVHNPNMRLLEALTKAGVEVLVCGQSAIHKGFTAEEFLPGVEHAVSAMSAHVRRQSEGYVLIPF